MKITRRSFVGSVVSLPAAVLAMDGRFSRASASDSPSASNDVGADTNYQLIYERGIEAVLWSMPAMSDVFFREALVRDFGMKPGDVLVMSKPLVARHEVLTPNNQVNYAAMAYDVSQGPWVVVIPASTSQYSVIGEICDNWQAPITMVGLPGPDKGKGGKYLLLPPGSSNKPPSGYIPIRLQGFRGTMVFRPVVTGSGTMTGAIALANKTQVYPLARSTSPSATRVVDPWDKALHSLPAYDISWFKLLAKFINDEPIRDRDKVMVGMLSSLGIEKGKPFSPDANTTKALNAAVEDGYAIMQRGFVTPGQALAAWWPDSQWMNMNPAMLKLMGQGWSYESADAVWTYERAITPFFWANYLPIKLGGDQMYLEGLRDSTGALLKGQGTYRLRVPADVPVTKFWSVVAYSQKTKAFIPNALNRVGLSSYDKKALATNPDGSVDIYLGNSAPSAAKSNWIPSAGQDLFVIFRLYGPQKSVYEKTWRMPDIQAV